MSKFLELRGYRKNRSFCGIFGIFEFSLIFPMSNFHKKNGFFFLNRVSKPFSSVRYFSRLSYMIYREKIYYKDVPPNFFFFFASSNCVNNNSVSNINILVYNMLSFT